MLPTWFWLLLGSPPVIAIGLFIAAAWWHPGVYIGLGLLAAWGIGMWWLARNTRFN